jgi:hypothetical protein
MVNHAMGGNMKFFINVSEGLVAIDGRKASDLSMAELPEGVVRVGWHGTFGEEHFLDDGVVKVRRFFDTAPYSSTLAAAEAAIFKEESVSNIEPTYADLRASEYPDAREYLDGVVKGDQAQIDAYISACNAVKAKYPKPE